MIQDMAAGRRKMDGILLLSVFYLTTCVYSFPTEYNVGIGMADITGPAADVNMMGYNNPYQKANGLHLRSYSRAFIFADSVMKNRVVYVNVDSCMMSQVIKLEVIERLNATFGALYTARNVLISGTHTFSAAGGYNQYILYDVTANGFVRETYADMADGIIKSIENAHANIKPANMYVNSGDLLDSNINRSPSAYLLNPPDERKRYEYDVDKTMTVLKIVDADENPLGMISWFAVDGSSMNNTNRLLSSDNKGYASILFEETLNGNTTMPGKGPFVAAFGQSNSGDVSPNIRGGHCMVTGEPCNMNSTSCNGFTELCVASGPGRDMFESTKIIATNQYNKAMDLFKSATIPVSGPVDFRHTYTDMSNQTLGEGKDTCKPALGESFGTGTTDAPGAFDFRKGYETENLLWSEISNYIQTPSREQIKCHRPKRIMLDTGKIKRPYPWQPTIVDTQILQLGQVIIIAVPAAFTTMAGRRTRTAVARTLLNADFPEPPVTVISGFANDYADYVTTIEEYQEQRFEGGATIYGPYTLDAYMQVFNNLSLALAKGSPVAPGKNPPNLLKEQISFLTPTRPDRPPLGKQFGQTTTQPLSSYKPNDKVTVRFVGANPRNSQKTESTFLEVQRKVGNSWNVEFTDAHWETKFSWRPKIFEVSETTITWDIPATVTPGTYRIVYHGDHKSYKENITPFNGTTNEFSVAAARPTMVTVDEDVAEVPWMELRPSRSYSERRVKYDWFKNLMEKKVQEEQLNH